MEPAKFLWDNGRVGERELYSAAWRSLLRSSWPRRPFMQTTTPLTRLLLSTFFLATAAIGVAQGPPGQDPYNPPPGHGGVPPGQAKKGGDHVPPGQAKKEGYDHVPPGQAKKYRDDYHFQSNDRGRF